MNLEQQKQGTFTAFGIPVTIEPFFLFGMVIMYTWAGEGRAGLFAVVALAIFILIHELGHALTARSCGLDSAITLTFFGGYAAMGGARLTGAQQDLISVMGPAVQFIAGVPALFTAQMIYRTNPELGWELYWAIGWAGILIALMNLMPLWPLDGGHIAERWFIRAGGNSRTFLIFSIAASVALLAARVMRLHESDFVNSAYRGMMSGIDDTVFAGIAGIVGATPGVIIGSFWPIALFSIFGSYQRLSRI